MGSRTKTIEYRGWRIESSPTSHLGTRLYEAGIFGAAGLADVAFGGTRQSAVANAVNLVDRHLTGDRLLHNLALARS
jgi:hypothetical protein